MSERYADAGRLALVAVTRGGARLAARVAAALPGATVYAAERWCSEAGPAAQPIPRGGLGPLVGQLFATCDGLVLFTAVGVAVRLVAPWLQSKYEDPAVVAVDEAGRYAVSVLSGHLGGGNALAERVAPALGAQAVITTASEARGTLAVDLLGREHGWRIENLVAVKRVSAALVNGEPVGVFQDAGEECWREREEVAALVEFESLEALAASGWAGLVVTDRLLPAEVDSAAKPWVIYRPRSLVLGVGASSGVEAEEVEALCGAALEEGGLAWASVAEVATLDRKLGEWGLMEFVERHGLGLRGFAAADLARVEVPHPSAVVAEHVGTASVCEAAALGAAGGELVMPKRKSARATVAIARRPSTSSAS